MQDADSKSNVRRGSVYDARPCLSIFQGPSGSTLGRHESAGMGQYNIQPTGYKRWLIKEAQGCGNRKAKQLKSCRQSLQNQWIVSQCLFPIVDRPFGRREHLHGLKRLSVISQRGRSVQLAFLRDKEEDGSKRRSCEWWTDVEVKAVIDRPEGSTL